jgi:hypothetical protein
LHSKFSNFFKSVNETVNKYIIHSSSVWKCKKAIICINFYCYSYRNIKFSELPLETWTDVFGFVLRSQLVKLLPHIGEEMVQNKFRNNTIRRGYDWARGIVIFSSERHKRTRQGRICSSTIGDRQFVSFVQFYLHKCGQITLGKFDLTKSQVIDQRDWPFPDVPMPTNIKNFKELTIRRFNFFNQILLVVS